MDLILYLTFLFEPATLQNGKCTACQKWHVTSKVTMSAYSTCTSMFCGAGYYDEAGKFHPPTSCNTCTTGGTCSRKHRIVVAQ